jgi:hypothetical protein
VSDSDFLLRVLQDGGWHSRDSILARSFAERGCGLTIHSRAADLRRKGYSVEVDVRGGTRRASFYRLGALEAGSAGRAFGGSGDGVSLLPASSAGSASSASSPVVSPHRTPPGREGALDYFQCVIDESGGLA